MSHPTWVCGLKLLTLLLSSRTQRVTPYVGVWIETLTYNRIIPPGTSHPTWVCGLKPSLSRLHRNSRSHTLRGCVDWNTAFAVHVLENHRHTLRGCVDWNIKIVFVVTRAKSHTLRGCVDWNFTGLPVAFEILSHTLRGCVDWNYHGCNKLRLAGGHTLRGCVDWNNCRLNLWNFRAVSHPTWVCGLKQVVVLG